MYQYLICHSERSRGICVLDHSTSLGMTSEKEVKLIYNENTM